MISQSSCSRVARPRTGDHARDVPRMPRGIPQRKRSSNSLASMIRRTSRRLVLALAASGCWAPSEESPPDPTSLFVEDVMISGRVLENVTACEVDAVCFLRIQFADTSVLALYGTGERPPPPCTMSTEVSDTAFGARPRDVISVVISRCGDEGHYIRQIVLGPR